MPSSPSNGARVRVVEVVLADAVFRVGPDAEYDRRNPLEAGTRLRVTREQDGWLCADLGVGQKGWIKASDVRDVSGEPWETNCLRNVLVRPGTGESMVDLQMSRRVPYDVLEDTATSSLIVRLHDTRLMMHEVLELSGASEVRGASVRQVDEGHVEIRVQLATPFVWGWTASYGPLVASRVDPPGHRFADISPVALGLRVRPAPVLSRAPGLRLQGLTVVVDPGHGGEDPGAVGLAGTREKDVNLAVALALRERLVARGARVVMTREADETIGNARTDLETRVRKAREESGHIFVSIHHNARARLEDGRVARGVYVYYYRDQSADLARALTDPVAKALDESFRGHVWRSFHVIRPATMPSVLVEVAFLSNPEEERRMREASWAPRVADGLVEGIEAFIRERCGP